MTEQDLLHLFALRVFGLVHLLSEFHILPRKKNIVMLCLTVFSLVMLGREGFCLWKQLLLFLVTVMMLLSEITASL